MDKKKGFERKAQVPAEQLEQTANKLNEITLKPKSTGNSGAKMYSYSMKLDDELEKRVSLATKKHRYTKKAFFLLAIEHFLDHLDGV
jgi:hypothetical protein